MNERERIELLMKCYELSPSQFADRTGIQRASVSHIISGRNKPSLEVLQKIYDAFPELDIKWLMTGNGEEPVVKGEGGSDAAVLENNLFAQPLQEQPVEPLVQQVAVVTQEPSPLPGQVSSRPAVERQQRKPSIPKLRPQQPAERRIKEVRIFYTDGTYETLVPEK